MTFDYYAFLDKNEASKNPVNATGLADLGDRCLLRARHDKKEACQNYRKQAAKQEYPLPSDLHLEPDHAFLPDPAWFAIDISFTLASPWYSKDDRPLHVLDNPVRKDRVFGVPFMSATSWMGLLRWACRMQAGLSEHLEKHDMRMEGWKDPPWILHLFGNERGEDERFRSGALVCHPTWFDKVNFEVINPHDRARRAGTQPIYYEVVPAGTEGKLQLLYAPLPGEIERDQTTPDAFISDFIDSIRALLENYGISAKRTAGWGKAEIDLKKSKLHFVKGDHLYNILPDVPEVPYEAPSDAGDTPSLQRKEVSIEEFIDAMAKTGKTRQGGNP
ncbi:MAG: RAMP superfamily CRISPR-associated protein [Fretibacterium sp.]|nr:RAMP superfamily CRISPR-associated protein [Fretibacterium sp.]